MRGCVIGLVLLALAGGSAHADALADVVADQRAVTTLDAARAKVEGHRVALEAQSRDAATQIERLKISPAGIRRDAQLQELLAAQKATSDELERVAGDLRGRSSLLTGARKKLIADCDRALAGQLVEAQRIELARLRTAQATLLTLPDRPPSGPLEVTRANANPLDGPRELQDKADLLRDSEDKLRREVQRLSVRIDSVERRRHLRERAGAVDEDLFGEAVSNRRSPRIASTAVDRGDRNGAPNASTPAPMGSGGTTSGGGVATPGTNGGGGAMAPGTAGGGGGAGGSGGGPVPPVMTPGGGLGGSSNAPPSAAPPVISVFGSGATSDTATVLRNLVDPATLDELRRSDGGDDLDRQVRALRRAQSELTGLADELDRRARSLSARADELKHRK
jgi:hypothetical protein